MIKKNGFTALFSMISVVAAAAGCAQRQEMQSSHPIRPEAFTSSPVAITKIFASLPTPPGTPSYTVEKGFALPPFGYADFCHRMPGECPEQALRETPAPPAINTAKGNTASVVSYNVFAPEGMRAIDHVSALEGGGGLARVNGNVLELLAHINQSVNHAVLPVTDQAGFGKDELWRIPEIRAYRKDIGDCEDYALLKRKRLIDAGFNFKDLSLTVVRRPNTEIHAVLLVKTHYGDLVLDNLEDEVKLWSDTPYAWMKRQSRSAPYRWVTI